MVLGAADGQLRRGQLKHEPEARDLGGVESGDEVDVDHLEVVGVRRRQLHLQAVERPRGISSSLRFRRWVDSGSGSRSS